MRVINFIFILISISCTLEAQLPKTNIYVLDMRANEQKVLLNNPKFVTSFNPEGYNNQPHFIDRNNLLITSDHESLGLTDILQLNLSEEKISRFTWTEESEYSATLSPEGNAINVVRQELDDSQPVPQVLWEYPLDKSHSGQQIIQDLTTIGYFTYVTKDKLALFLVDPSAQLVLYDLKLRTQTPISSNGGRCLKARNGNVYFVKNQDGVQTLMAYDIYLGRSKRVADLSGYSQDYEILPNGFIITSAGSKLFVFNPLFDAQWTELIDLAGADVKNISRIAATFDKIAIVTSD